MKRKSLVLFIVLAGITMIPMMIFAQSLAGFNIMTSPNPPFNFEDGKTIKGISTEILQTIFSENGRELDSSEISMLPWARAYSAISTKPDQVHFSMARTEQREKMFKWVGPIYHLTIGLIAKKSRNLKINTVADLSGYNIGALPDGAPEQLLVKAGYDKSKLDRKSSPITNLKKLDADRIDMFVYNIPSALYMMSQVGMKATDYETVYALKEVDLYFAFSIQTDDAVIKSLQASLDKMKEKQANGKSQYDSIVEKYF